MGVSGEWPIKNNNRQVVMKILWISPTNILRYVGRGFFIPNINPRIYVTNGILSEEMVSSERIPSTKHKGKTLWKTRMMKTSVP